MARIILEAGGEPKEYPITQALIIGRAKDNDVFLDDSQLSRAHTRISFEGRGYFVNDLNSKNGTYLNGVRIAQQEMLRPGDRVRLGQTTFRFELDDADHGLSADVRAPRSATNVTAPAATAVPPSPTPAGGIARPGRDREKEPLTVEGPSVVTKVVLWLLLLAIFGGALYGARLVFIWALKRAVQP